MTSGSADYWTTKDNWMYSLLSIVKDAVKEGGLIQLAMDSMDGKLDGFVNLADLTEAQTIYLAKMFLTDTVDGDGKNLLTKLDNLDGKTDGRLDLNLMKTFDIFYDNTTIVDGIIDLAGLTEAQTVYLAKMFLTDTVDGGGKNLLTKLDNLDGIADGKLDLSKLNYALYESHNNYPRYETNEMVAQLITAVSKLNTIKNNTNLMAAYGQADTGGTITPSAWTLISDVNVRRSMLEVTHESGYGLYYSRNGSTNHGSIPTSGSTLFFDAPGVWLKSWAGGNGVFSAHEEWAT